MDLINIMDIMGIMDIMNYNAHNGHNGTGYIIFCDSFLINFMQDQNTQQSPY